MQHGQARRSPSAKACCWARKISWRCLRCWPGWPATS